MGLTHEDPRLVLINGLKQQHYAGKIAVSTHAHDVEPLLSRGADLVVTPFQDPAKRAVARIMEGA